ncbi:MAG: hypothetical protein NC324_10820 [Bacteroides sp.]|nr:hypothetical protein [Bacteroides sp.]
MFGKFKVWFWQRRVRAVLRHNKTSRKTSGLSDAYRVGIYYAYRNEAEMESLRAFACRLAQMGKKVRVLVCMPGKEMPDIQWPGVALSFFGKRDLDWRFFPQREVSAGLEEFLDSDHDLLLDFSPEFHYTDVAVMAMCVSHMKVGKFTPWNLKVNDLCLAPEAGQDYVAAFIRTLETYLPLFDGGRANV